MKNKKNNLLKLSVLVFCLSLSVSAQKSGGKETQIPDLAEISVGHIEEDIKLLKELWDGNSRVNNALPPEGKKYIMTVTDFFPIIASDYIGNNQPSVLTNDIVFMLTGKASPSSPQDFTKAYLVFVDSSRPLRRPQITQRTNEKVLTIWYPLQYASTVEKTLKEAKNVYCWIGNYSDAVQKIENIHADIHADY